MLAALVIILSLTDDFVLGPWVMNKLEGPELPVDRRL